MTRLVSAEEARGLLEGATPGPWRSQIAACDHGDAEEHAAIKGGGSLVVTCVGDQDAGLIAAAPDLAATVIALSEERDRLRDILACERGEKAPEGWRWAGTFWTTTHDRARVASIGDGYAHTAIGQWCAERYPTALEAIEAADRAAAPK